MKHILLYIIIPLMLMASGTAMGQEKLKKIQTEAFIVEGNCDMCKERIEEAAFIKGVRSAEWNKIAQTLTVIYSTKKADLESIHKAVAKSGHDTEMMKATDEAYNKLAKCCQYRDKKDIH